MEEDNMNNDYINRSSFGRFLKEKRREAGLTQLNLSELINRDVRTTQRYESGDCFPTIDALVNLCKILNISIEELIKFISGAEDDEKEDKKKKTEQIMMMVMSRNGYLTSAHMHKDDIYSFFR